MRHGEVEDQVTAPSGVSSVYSVAFSPDGTTLAAGCYEKIYFLDPTAGEIKSSLRGHRYALSKECFLSFLRLPSSFPSPSPRVPAPPGPRSQTRLFHRSYSNKTYMMIHILHTTVGRQRLHTVFHR